VLLCTANFYQKCHDQVTNQLLPFQVCEEEALSKYLVLLKGNFAVLNGIHQGLFLGKTNLRQFRDQRLVVSETGVEWAVLGATGRRVGAYTDLQTAWLEQVFVSFLGSCSPSVWTLTSSTYVVGGPPVPCPVHTGQVDVRAA
jgi:hypothetical protein